MDLQGEDILTKQGTAGRGEATKGEAGQCKDLQGEDIFE